VSSQRERSERPSRGAAFQPAATSEARTLRLFVAIELPDDLKRALEDAIATLKRAGAEEGLRWVRPEGIHLTLKFLGATPPDRVPAIVEALREGLKGGAPFTAQPEGIGAFYGGKHAVGRREWVRPAKHHNIRVVWVGFAGTRDAQPGPIVQLAERVEVALTPLGYSREKQTFFPHLTLARVRDEATREQRENLFRALEPYSGKSVITGNFRQELVPTFPAIHIRSVSLMQSTLQPGGAVYRALETFPLEQ
jgi:2'-5' RNA ligase